MKAEGKKMPAFRMFACFALLELAVFSTALTGNQDRNHEILLPLNWTSAFHHSVDVDSEMPIFATSASFEKNSRHNKTVITLIMSNSYGGEMPVGAISTKAMELALDQLRKLPNWLPNYDLALELVDDECIDSTTINRVVPMLRQNEIAQNRFPIFLSPGCEAFGLRTVAEVIQYFNFIGINALQTSSAPFRNRQRFSSFFSLGEQNDLPHIALAEFISRMGWRKVAILSEAFPYYDELEATFLPLLDEKNITLLWRGKVCHAGVFDGEMRQALDEMIRYDPRIIIVDADRGAGKACWLHRYGLYGPNYVIFFFYWSDVYPEPAVPDNLADWCTVDMINEVLAYSFILGDATIIDTFGMKLFDSSEISGEDWEAEMERKLMEPKDSPFWQYWRMQPYDLTLFTGYLLNTTEQLLNQKNQTLIDWVTSSENFIANGSEIAEVLKEAIYLTEVHGLKGEYHFEKRTAVNSLGYTPITITQMRPPKAGETKPSSELVALYKSGNNLTIFRDRIQWTTKNGQPTKDAIEIAMVFIPLVGKVDYAVLCVLALLAMITCAILFGILVFQVKFTSTFQRFEHARFNFEDGAILFGNIVMIAQILVLPVESQTNAHINCILIAAFLAVGYSTSIYGILMKLENFGRRYAFRTPLHAILLGIWLTIQASLLGAFLTVSQLESTFVNMTLQRSNIGSETVEQPYQYVCAFKTDLRSNQPGLGLLGTLAAIHVCLIIRAAFVAYKLRSRQNQVPLSVEVKNTTMSVFCVIICFAAGGFIVVLISNYIFAIISSVTLCYVTISTCLSIFPKFIRNEETNVLQSAMPFRLPTIRYQMPARRSKRRRSQAVNFQCRTNKIV